MAVTFGGFTPDQLGKIVPEMQGMQADEQAKFLAATPGAAARVGRMSEVAQRKIDGALKAKGFAVGGLAEFNQANQEAVDKFNAEEQQPPTFQAQFGKAPANTGTGQAVEAGQVPPVMMGSALQQPPTLTDEQRSQLQSYAKDNKAVFDAANQASEKLKTQAFAEAGLSGPPKTQQEADRLKPIMQRLTDSSPEIQAAKAVQQQQKNMMQAKVNSMDNAGSVERTVGAPTVSTPSTTSTAKTELDAAELMATGVNSPEDLVTKATTATTSADQAKAGEMDASAGQAGDAKQAAVTTVGPAAEVATPDVKPAVTVEAATSEEAVNTALDKLVAATGKPSEEALADAATMSPDQLAQLGINAATLEEAQKVQAPDARTVQQGELIEGSTVDMDRVEGAVNYTAATGVPSSEATVQGQLTGLLEQFEGGDTPPWAAGAMRAATAALASRGLGASSMAGQAVVQAAMESALPIAQADANTRAQFESQNLSNRQQAATFAAQQRANFLGVEFDQEFQTRVQNAARISDIANMNFSAEQQVALENARLAQSVDLANLSNLNAKVLSDAAAMSQVDMTNLNNRQQAQVQQANAFLQTDLANLNNEQQTAVFKAQALTNTLLSDTAAENAAAQFNASSQTQTDQFFANLTASVGQFNANQINAMSRFDAGEVNAAEQFNTTQQNLREQFNAANSLIIEQANANWYQKISTTDNAAINQSNRDAAASANNMTSLAFNAAMQETRDLMSYAFQAADNDATRAVQLAVARLASSDAKAAANATKQAGMWGAFGSLAAALAR